MDMDDVTVWNPWGKLILKEEIISRQKRKYLK